MSRHSAQSTHTFGVMAADKPALSKQELATLRIRRGRALVIGGFVVTILGVIGYCAVTFAGGMHLGVAELLLESTTPFVTTLVVIGAGTLLWLVGSMMYLIGAVDSDTYDDSPSPPDSRS